MGPRLHLEFDHGLGDCANFAHILELYKRRGYEITLQCPTDKEFIFRPSGLEMRPFRHPGSEYVHYYESWDPHPDNEDRCWEYNKAGTNVGADPMPDIGDAYDMWRELCDVELDITPFVGDDAKASAEAFVRDLPRPIVLFHSMGNTSQEEKNVPRDQIIEICRQLLRRMEGTIVLLDWDDRVPRLANWRVRHLTDDWKWLDVEHLVALLDRSDLLISVDSGPLHLAKMTSIPALGVFPTLTKHPARVALPRKRTAHIIPKHIGHDFTRTTRMQFNILESPGEEGFDVDTIVETAVRMLAGPRYLDDDHLGADMLLQQFVREWQRGEPNGLSAHVDRDQSWDLVFRRIRDDIPSPTIVETGCIRASEDWKGAGYSTYLLAAFTHHYGGELISVDCDRGCCDFARNTVKEMRSATVIQQESVEFLRGFDRPIDVLFLDSMDTWMEDAPDHTREEIRAALPLLHENSIVIFDDTVYRAGHFTGLGSRAVPWLLEQDWKILYSGYQTVCVPKGAKS